MAGKSVFARYKFNGRKKVLFCIGQRQTRRGTYYPAKMVQVPLPDKTAETLKKAMAQGIKELNESD